MWIADNWNDFEVLDCSDGDKYNFELATDAVELYGTIYRPRSVISTFADLELAGGFVVSDSLECSDAIIMRVTEFLVESDDADANGSTDFRYSAYFMAYNYCMDAIRSMNTIPSNAAMIRVENGVSPVLKADLDAYHGFFKTHRDDAKKQQADEFGALLGEKDIDVVEHFTDLLVSWHIQEVVIPSQEVEVIPFNPLDENQVDLTVIPTPTETQEATEEE
jgi:hypothetical protein